MIRVSAHLAFLAGVAISGIFLAAPEAKALCLPNDSICSTFDPSTPSTPTNVQSFTGTGSSAGGAYGYVRIIATASNFSGSSFSLSNFSLSGDGLNAGTTGFGNILISGNGPAVSTGVQLVAPITDVNYANSLISFTIPAGVGGGTALSIAINYSENSSFVGGNQAESLADFTTSAISPSTPSSVPAPLPLLGAGAAFTFSRQLRRRTTATPSSDQL